MIGDGPSRPFPGLISDSTLTPHNVTTQSDSGGQTQLHQHHRVQSSGRVERHSGVHLQQRRNQSHRHGQTSRHQEEAAACGETVEDRIQVDPRDASEGVGAQNVKERF